MVRTITTITLRPTLQKRQSTKYVSTHHNQKREQQKVYTCCGTIAGVQSRENEGTERDIQGVGWDMSIPLKLFLVLGGNGRLFPQTSA